MLTREEMLDVFAKGGTMIVNGRHILTIGELPGEEELVELGLARRTTALADVDAQIEALQLKRARIDAAAPEAPGRDEGLERQRQAGRPAKSQPAPAPAPRQGGPGPVPPPGPGPRPPFEPGTQS